MARVRAEATVELAAAAAQQLWTDTSRWPTFVDGFGRLERVDAAWPEPGARVVWSSGPAGRGRVTERVEANDPGLFVASVFEERMRGTQTVVFDPEASPADPDAPGTTVTIVLDYELAKRGPFAALTDVLFIRRALTEALERTLARFSTEAAEQATL